MIDFFFLFYASSFLPFFLRLLAQSINQSIYLTCSLTYLSTHTHTYLLACMLTTVVALSIPYLTLPSILYRHLCGSNRTHCAEPV